MTKRLCSSAEVAELTGLSLRQLQYWDECGWICPMQISVRGKRTRQYSDLHVQRLKFVAILRHHGFTTNRALAVSAKWKPQYNKLLGWARRVGIKLS